MNIRQAIESATTPAASLPIGDWLKLLTALEMAALVYYRDDEDSPDGSRLYDIRREVMDQISEPMPLGQFGK